MTPITARIRASAAAPASAAASAPSPAGAASAGRCRGGAPGPAEHVHERLPGPRELGRAGRADQARPLGRVGGGRGRQDPGQRRGHRDDAVTESRQPYLAQEQVALRVADRDLVEESELRRFGQVVEPQAPVGIADGILVDAQRSELGQREQGDRHPREQAPLHGQVLQQLGRSGAGVRVGHLQVAERELVRRFDLGARGQVAERRGFRRVGRGEGAAGDLDVVHGPRGVDPGPEDVRPAGVGEDERAILDRQAGAVAGGQADGYL
jgi:hypothetical protein